MNCLIKSLFLCNFKKFQHIPDWNHSSGKWSAEPSSLTFQSYIEILWVAPSGLEISVLEKCDFHDFTWQSYLCDVQRYSLLPRLKLFTQELGSRLSIVAVAFLSNLIGASFLMPILACCVLFRALLLQDLKILISFACSSKQGLLRQRNLNETWWYESHSRAVL